MAGPARDSTDVGAWVEAWLSEPRLARYLAESGGDRARALDLYEWNLRLGAALMRDIAHVEVAVRNAYDRVMRERWHGTRHWLLDPASPVLAPRLRSRSGTRADLNARLPRSTQPEIERRTTNRSSARGRGVI